MSSKPFTIDPLRESLYVYAPMLVTQVLREELEPEQFDKTMQELSTATYKNQIINKFFEQVMSKVIVKFKNDTKVVADCEKERLTPEELKDHYNLRVLEAVNRAFSEWQAHHPETHFKRTSPVNFETNSLLDSCIIL